MNIIFCAWRQWALDVVPTIRKHPKVTTVEVATTSRWLEHLLNGDRKYDLILFCGWSDPPSEELVKRAPPMFSEHPASSDRYSPGTPLQNQILDGISRTKHRLVRVGFPELSPRQWSHEVDMELSGNMSDILEQMSATSKVLFTRFLDDYPNITWNTWPELSSDQQIPRRTPDMSELQRSVLATMTTKQLYDNIRCLESPYPNAYIEDDVGRLYFKHVEFERK